jgi:anaerobic C4-dicarboxylate transporter DcuB
MFWIEMLLLLVIIYFGIKYGGVALGLLGGLGVTILVFAFRMAPGNPPIEVMLIILAVVTTSATLEATGALNLIVRYAEKLLRKNPKYVVYLAPSCTFILTMLLGTGHAVYPLLPVIYDVSYKQGIRPERPMAISSVAAQLGITASPIAAATAAVMAISAKYGAPIQMYQILEVTIPSGIIGMLVAATWSLNRGLDLSKDPAFLQKLNDPEQKKYMEGGVPALTTGNSEKSAKRALLIFLLGIASIVFIAMTPSWGLLPKVKAKTEEAAKPKTDKTTPSVAAVAQPDSTAKNTAVAIGADSMVKKANANVAAAKPAAITASKDESKPVSMAVVIQFMILATGAVILFLTNVKPKAISDTKVFNAGMVAVIMIFGIAWMSETVIEGNKPYIISLISDSVKAHPWTYALAMFCFSAFLKSQAATLIVMLPLAYALHLPASVIIGCIPASYAYFFFCFYPSDLATINFDRTGTTHIGKYILNHSFMIPGLLAVGTSTVVAYLLANYVY